MHLLPYLILGYVAVGVQVGLSGFAHLGRASPNLVLIAAVFLALVVPREPARLACFALGLMQDLLTQQTLGLYAISYGLIGVVIGNSQAMVFSALGSSVGLSCTVVVFTTLNPPGYSPLQNGARYQVSS